MNPRQQAQPISEPMAHRRTRLKSLVVDCDLLKVVVNRFGIDIRAGRGHGYEEALADLLEVLEQANFSIEEEPEDREPVEGDEAEGDEAGKEGDQSDLPGSVMSQAISDQAKTLAWLTDRISILEMEGNQLKQERDTLQNRLTATDGAQALIN